MIGKSRNAPGLLLKKMFQIADLIVTSFGNWGIVIRIYNSQTAFEIKSMIEINWMINPSETKRFENPEAWMQKDLKRAITNSQWKIFRKGKEIKI